MFCCVFVCRILKRVITHNIMFSEKYLCFSYSMLLNTSYFMLIRRKRESNVIWNKMEFWIKTRPANYSIFFSNTFLRIFKDFCLRCLSAATRFLGCRFRIPPRAWIFFFLCVLCCQRPLRRADISFTGVLPLCVFNFV